MYTSSPLLSYLSGHISLQRGQTNLSPIKSSSIMWYKAVSIRMDYITMDIANISWDNHSVEVPCYTRYTGMSQQQGSYHVHQAKNISYFYFGMFSAAAVYSLFLPMFGLGSSMVQPWFSHVSATVCHADFILFFGAILPQITLMEKRENPESNLSQTWVKPE